MIAMRLSTLRTALLAATVIGAATVGGNAPARAQDYLKAGVLTCAVSGGVGLILGSRRSVDCTFAPDTGLAERYTGTIRRIGLDIGVTGGAVIVWGVLSSVRGYQPGALGGTYGGVSADASVVVGGGANVLLGGSNRSFALQPLSVQGQVGLNLAVGVSSLTLVYSP